MGLIETVTPSFKISPNRLSGTKVNFRLELGTLEYFRSIAELKVN